LVYLIPDSRFGKGWLAKARYLQKNFINNHTNQILSGVIIKLNLKYLFKGKAHGTVRTVVKISAREIPQFHEGLFGYEK